MKENTVKAGKRELLPDGRPKCVTEGCTRPGQHLGKSLNFKDGSTRYRVFCEIHHRNKYDMDGGYAIHKKKYCENIDGRLGFVCTTTGKHGCMFDVDHTDNNHSNNSESNLQTLCSSCHPYKTERYGKFSGETVLKIFSENQEKFKKIAKKSVDYLDDDIYRYLEELENIESHVCHQPNKTEDEALHIVRQVGNYKYHRGHECENKDGRLGFECTTTIKDEAQLTVDHINHIHSDNRASNFQTLCKSCHNFKTKVCDIFTEKTIRIWLSNNQQKFKAQKNCQCASDTVIQL